MSSGLFVFCNSNMTFCVQIFLVTGDVTVKEDVDRIMDETVKHFGRLDVLINNAGATRARNIDTCTIEDLDWCYNVLVRSVFMMTKAAIPHLEKTKGAILNMSSLAGLRPVSNIVFHAIYPESKNKYLMNSLIYAYWLTLFNILTPWSSHLHKWAELFKKCLSVFVWNMFRQHF